MSVGVDNDLNTQSQINCLRFSVGKIKPQRLGIRGFWFKYLFTSSVIVGTLLSFPGLKNPSYKSGMTM